MAKKATAKSLAKVFGIDEGPDEPLLFVRKVVQVTSVKDFIVVLCNDGTMWKKIAHAGSWEQVPAVPGV